MKYLSALWQALMAFFSHLKKHQEDERSTGQAKEQTEQVEAKRDQHDQEVRSSNESNVDQRLDKWMRD